MKIRSKLILMLAIPVVALAVIAFAGFREQSAQAETNERAGEIADAIVGLENIALELADERLAVVQIGFASLDAENRGNETELDELTEQLAAAIELTDAELANIDRFASRMDDDFQSRVAEVEASVAEARVGAANASADSLESYGDALTSINQAIEGQLLTGFSADAVLAVAAIQDAREVVNTQESVWIEFFSLTSAEVTPEVVAAIVGGFGHVDFVAESSSSVVLSNGRSLLEQPANSSTFSQLSRLRALAEEDVYERTPGDLTVQEVLPLVLDNRREWNTAAVDAAEFIKQDIEANNSLIDDRRSLFTLLAVLGAFTVFTLMFVIGRSILGPLRRLMDHADKTTNERLPFAVAKLRTLGATDEVPSIREIPRETSDEIGSLVDAFNDIQHTAINIATDQAKSRRNVAEMFVSLGRRNQQLNHRMISLISDLERDEQDPETLAGLYQLDHLATRMRRNAESLLVLAGNRSPRQWSRPVNMEDVIRQSLAEVELFERVEVGDLPDVAMQGNVVTDVTHLLAELLDNATQFSEPSTTVQVSAQETLEGVEIEVFDEGFGIGEKDLIDLNERVTNPPALDEAPSRLLGLFVVGRLSQQHGIDVSLQSQPGVGTVATIAIPTKLFAEAERVEIEAPSSALLDEPTPTTVTGLESLIAPAAAPEGPAQDIREELAEANSAIAQAPVEESLIAQAPAEEFSIAPPSEEPTALDMPSTDDDFEALQSPTLPVDIAAPTAEPEPVSIGAVDEATPAWDPAAVHEEQLADAAMPTMEEVEDAMPSFPGVTIDPPQPAPAAPAENDEHWPFATLDSPEAPAPTSMAALDAMPPAAEIAAPEMTAPEVATPEPAMPETPQPEAAIPQPEAAIPQPEAAIPQPEAFAPAPAPQFAAPVEPELPEPPVVEAAPQLPAPPVVSVAPPVAEMPHPEVSQEPSSTSTFGGLPTRSPQAALVAAEETPSVIPLSGARDMTTEAKPSNPAAFAAFASGVNRGLDKVRETPEPKFSNEGENE